ncbi:hypothetical protein Cni_G12370 [Canna indica]|uniref:RING-type E3 ubiquitin transferase n=1 Tax=Canna indica TaxID=4628 RepID=A0AAQ3K9M8_9LILI|nr:hypothetical protein Cni_G12370 [Canna indica]
MEAVEIQENTLVVGDPKLHGGMFTMLSRIVHKVLDIFPLIEAARPRSKSGIQSLCSLHVALDKGKGLLHHCSDCSKLYLAITGECILLKFGKAKCALQESLRRVEDIVPEAIACQIMDIVGELEETTFLLDHSEKQAGDEVIALLQKYRRFNNSSACNEELEAFYQAASRLGITSSRAALAEKRALKKLMEKAHAEGDKRKETVVAYLYHLMRKYSKLFRSDLADDVMSQGSAPCSPTVLSPEEASGLCGNTDMFARQLSKIHYLDLKEKKTNIGKVPIPPEEFRCPISLQLMFDPVIISSGQTYERVCIEKWFNDGNIICPKTQQQLCHLCLTPNYCVKGLIANWCEQNGVPLPDGPPDFVEYWRLPCLQYDAMDCGSLDSAKPCKWKGVNEVGFEDCSVAEVLKGNQNSPFDGSNQDTEFDELERCRGLLAALNDGKNLLEQLKAVKHIGNLMKDSEEARVFMGSIGACEALVHFLRLAIQDENAKAQEIGSVALFNLAVENNRNKGMLISAGVIPLLDQIISNSSNYELTLALYLNLSCLDEAKQIIGSSEVVPLLIQLLHAENSGNSRSSKHDAFHILHNLSMHPPNIPVLLSSGILDSLRSHFIHASRSEDTNWTEQVLEVLINLASSQSGSKEIVSTPGLLSGLAEVLDTGDPQEQEKAVSCLLLLCYCDEEYSQMVLQEGVVPSLVSVSLNGTSRGQEQAKKLLKLFREQRQQEQLQPVKSCAAAGELIIEPRRPFCKSRSKKLGRTLSSMWKNKSFAVFQC